VSPPRTQFGAFPATYSLLILIGLVFLLEVIAGGSTSSRVLLGLGANEPGRIVGQGEWWRMLTSAFLHIGVFHLLLNGWALLQIGRLAESTFGSALTLSLFVFTAITGSALTLLQPKVSAGASGAIFGLVGALVSFLLRHREHLTPTGRRILTDLLVWSAVLMAYSFIVPRIDWLGHLGGFLGGAAVGWALPVRRAERGWARGLAFVSAAAIAAALLTAVVRFF